MCWLLQFLSRNLKTMGGFSNLSWFQGESIHPWSLRNHAAEEEITMSLGRKGGEVEEAEAEEPAEAMPPVPEEPSPPPEPKEEKEEKEEKTEAWYIFGKMEWEVDEILI